MGMGVHQDVAVEVDVPQELHHRSLLRDVGVSLPAGGQDPLLGLDAGEADHLVVEDEGPHRADHLDPALGPDVGLGQVEVAVDQGFFV
jgi:hypothetical protein